MKQAQNARQQRGRPSSRQGGKSNRGPGNHRNEQQVRGNPKQLVEKYKNQARECLQAGDRMQAEYYFQFAEHYYRVLNETRSNAPNQGDRDNQQQNNKSQNNQQQNNQQQNNNRPKGQSGDDSGADDQQGVRQQRRGRRGRSHGDQQNTEPQTDASQPNAAAGAANDTVALNKEATKPDVQPDLKPDLKPDPKVAGKTGDQGGGQSENSQPAVQDTAKEVDAGTPKDSPAQLDLADAPPKPARRRAPRKRSTPVEETAAAAPLDPATSDLA